MTKEKYLLAKKNGLADRLRGDEISRRIAKKYPLSAQIALLMDKESKPAEWEAYQTYRRTVKDNVDAIIATFEADTI